MNFPFHNACTNLIWDTVQNCASNNHFQCTHAIFDLDDTIIQTDHLVEKIINRILANYDCGYRMNDQTNLERRGLAGFDLAAYLIEKFKLPAIKEDIRNEIVEYYPDYLPRAIQVPGAAKLIHHLAKNGIPMGIATTSSDLAFRYTIEKHKNLMRRFDHILLGNSDRMIRRGTPHPEMYVVCAARFGSRPSSCCCVVFEDSIMGIRAATNVGMKTVFVCRDPNTPYAWKAEANQTVKSLDEFQPEMFGFPSY